ncbi:lysophospholipid acyltransferase family protein [Dyadobacter chenhuakuii]|uniref:Lysophospholipid acyltransferase family protein n=1 Tax=Dyadobacter chenhuakuii TaxID=2909339 RepID=A0ABY4XLV3_9BACT|nr:lysophospholipid acyltransferase family protein [Dyadobacter chenhuakuii]MCF2493846.1 lysophospholipid acyltransferase family protein [Dyadobacter chenhuakuii]USJ30977.1 lysophospholipid acyltransferase family protein [Dyadobacter chenhuakuii]
MQLFVSKFLFFILNQVSKLSWKNAFRLSDFLRWSIFSVGRYRRDVIRENLKNSFPDKTDAELSRIAKDFQLHFTDLIVETLKFRTASPECVRERLQGDISIMDKFYNDKTNIIYLMGHRGNWELANLFSSLCFTHECIVVYRPLQNEASDQWFRDLRTRFGAKLVPMDCIFKELQKPRDKPYVVVLANDQSPNPKTAFWTRFLHQDTGVFRGVETIARRYNLTVLYADFSKVANKRGYYQVAISTITGCPKEVKNNEILEKQLRILENDIQCQPHNWLWSHRRWKHKRPACLKPEQTLN